MTRTESAGDTDSSSEEVGYTRRSPKQLKLENGQSSIMEGEEDDVDAESLPEVGSAKRRRKSPLGEMEPEGSLDMATEDEVEATEEAEEVLVSARRIFQALTSQDTAEGDDEDESEDEDWTPGLGMPVLRWSCVNCTTPNVDDAVHCEACGEHRRSAILNRGHLAVPEVAVEAVYPSSEQAQAESKVAGNTAVGFDERMLMHFEGKALPHPERPDRLRAIIAGLAADGLLPGRCTPFPVREATRKELELVHSHDHVEEVEATSSSSDVQYFTSDTYVNPHSALAARLAAGCSVDMAVAVATGKVKNGFALVRPPGHHAESSAVMGFCLHNNAAVAARAAQAAGAKKIMIIDWDVHHGNGTQEIFENDPTVLYVSLHRYEGGTFYPGTGGPFEVGTGPGAGFSVNIPWNTGGMGDADYLAAFFRVILPIAYQFSPDMTIVSAGFDAAAGDPLGGCEVTPAGYAQMTSLLMNLAGGRLLVILEGGYNLRSIAASVDACIKVLLGDAPPPLPAGYVPSEAALAAITDVCTVHSHYWPALGHHLPSPVAPTALPEDGTGSPTSNERHHNLVGDEDTPGHMHKNDKGDAAEEPYVHSLWPPDQHADLPAPKPHSLFDLSSPKSHAFSLSSPRPYPFPHESPRTSPFPHSSPRTT